MKTKTNKKTNSKHPPQIEKIESSCKHDGKDVDLLYGTRLSAVQHENLRKTQCLETKEDAKKRVGKLYL